MTGLSHNCFKYGFLKPILLSLMAIGLASGAQAADEKKPEQLNRYYQAGVSSAQQGAMETARVQFTIGCERDKDARSCFSAATMLNDGIGGPADKPKAKKLFESLCGSGMIQACMKLAMKENDKPGGLTPQKLAEFKTGCDKNDWKACNNLGAAHGRGAGGLPKDLARAKSLYTKACDGNFGPSCNNLALMSYHGEAGDKDPVTARALAQKSCDLKSVKGCVNYAAFLYQGIGGAVDFDAARPVAKFACDAKSGGGCVNYGQLLIRGQGGPVDPVGARSAFTIACDQNLALGCNNLGVLAVQGKGGARDTAQALAAFNKACQGGYQQGCKNVTQLTKELGSK